jgi:hypothetical protein
MKAEANNLLKIEELERRVAELEGWKGSAMTVLGEWHNLAKSLPKEHLDHFLGQSESTAVGAYIADLEMNGLLAFLEIRKAIGDSEGRLSQTEVVKKVQEMAEENAHLAESLNEMSAMYTHVWDRVDGGLTMTAKSVERFDSACDKAFKLLTGLKLGTKKPSARAVAMKVAKLSGLPDRTEAP